VTCRNFSSVTRVGMQKVSEHFYWRSVFGIYRVDQLLPLLFFTLRTTAVNPLETDCQVTDNASSWTDRVAGSKPDDTSMKTMLFSFRLLRKCSYQTITILGECRRTDFGYLRSFCITATAKRMAHVRNTKSSSLDRHLCHIPPFVSGAVNPSQH
jgi:hypothetical protein